MQTIIAGGWNKHFSGYPETRNLRVVRNKYDSGLASADDLGRAQDAVVKILLKELNEEGVSMVTDGGIRWDSIFDIAREIEGCDDFRQLTRIPETNHFHRQPRVNLPLSWLRPILLKDSVFARNYSLAPVVMSLPGPYSLARQTRNVADLGLERVAAAYAGVLNKEIRCLLYNGAAMVRVEDPQILKHPEDFAFFKDLTAQLLHNTARSRVALTTWFGDVTQLTGYFDLPFGIFFVDFIDGKTSIDTLGDFPEEKFLVAGIFDARHTYEEPQNVRRKAIDKILRKLSMERMALSTNTDLHFLPWDKAKLKVRNMVSLAKDYGGKT